MKLADRLYTETDDTCALCGIRDGQALTIHHIDGNRGNDVYGTQSSSATTVIHGIIKVKGSQQKT